MSMPEACSKGSGDGLVGRSRLAQGLETPLIHVIVPVYDVAPWLGRCIDSILSQAGCELRLVLVDDGSTDESGEMCDQVAAHDPRVRVVHTPNRGLSAARNLGIDIAMAEGAGLLTFVDPDDWLMPGALSALERALTKSGADLAWCGAESARAGGRTRIRVPVAVTVSGDDMWRAHLKGDLGVSAWGKLYRAKLFDGLRFPEGRVFEDIATTYRVLMRCECAVAIPVVGYHYLLRDGSISHTRSMPIIVDLWDASVLRHADLTSLLGDRPWARDRLERMLAWPISFVWRWTWGCGREEVRAQASLLADVSHRARSLPLLGRRGWPLRDRVGCFFAHFNCNASLAACYALNVVAARGARLIGR